MGRKGRHLNFLWVGKRQLQKQYRPRSPGRDKPRGGEKGAIGPKGRNSNFLGLGLVPNGAKSGHFGTPGFKP